MTRQKERKDDGAGKERRVRGAMARAFMRIPLLRRWYIRRILKFIDRSKTKGRRLPEGLAETARFLSRVPAHQRAEALEQAMSAQQDLPNMGREYRRAASRQRRSGQNETRYRPGTPPGGPRKRPRPR